MEFSSPADNPRTDERSLFKKGAIHSPPNYHYYILTNRQQGEDIRTEEDKHIEGKKEIEGRIAIDMKAK